MGGLARHARAPARRVSLPAGGASGAGLAPPTAPSSLSPCSQPAHASSHPAADPTRNPMQIFMTESDVHRPAVPPPPQNVAAQAQAASAPRPAAAQGLPAGSPSSGFRMPPHGPAYQAMHAMLQRRREQLQQLQQEAASSGTARGVFALGPPCLSMPHTIVVTASGGGQASTAATEPLQPMLSF